MAGATVMARRKKCVACGSVAGCTCEVDAAFASLAEEYTEFEQTAKQIKRAARLVATYYTTLTACGVDDEAALVLTQSWCETNVSFETDTEADSDDETGEPDTEGEPS